MAKKLVVSGKQEGKVEQVLMEELSCMLSPTLALVIPIFAN